ncbi:MAG TPA: Clp protease N-terminal domain-containing protein [Gemmataceae bacterium]|nr:Clp protease N-terminal domain-containing protein [Gemmataceae bacterium]
MYERFTDRARKVMQLANEEAIRLKHEYIGTEHILLGLIKEGSGVGALVLRDLYVDLGAVCREVEKIIIGQAETLSGKLPQTPRAKRVIEFAIEEARVFNHNHVGTEHLLLGLIREGEGVAAQVLLNLELKPEDVRERVLALVGPNEIRPLVVEKVEINDLPKRLGNAVKALDESLKWLQMMKEDAVSRLDFDWAASMRDQTDKLKKMREYLLREKHREPRDPSE